VITKENIGTKNHHCLCSKIKAVIIVFKINGIVGPDYFIEMHFIYDLNDFT